MKKSEISQIVSLSLQFNYTILYFGIIIIMNSLSKMYYYAWVKARTLNDLAEKSFEVFTREETVQCRPRDN